MVVAHPTRSVSMTEQEQGKRVHEKWATFNFSVIGLLLAAPPRRGELAGAITAFRQNEDGNWWVA